MPTPVRRSLSVVALAALLLVTLPLAAADAKLSTATALRETAQLARKVARENNGVGYFAFGCQRRRSNRVDCFGAVAFAGGEACGQRVRVVKKGRRTKATPYGARYCDVIYDGDSGSGGGGESSGEGTAVCAIRQSVCI